MVMPEVVNSNSHPSSHHPPSSHHQQQISSMMSPSSLSTEEYSSRYSSLQDTESLKSAILDSFRMHWIQAWSIMECKVLNDVTIDDLSSVVNHLEQMISLLIEENVTDVRTSLSDLKTEQTFASTTPSADSGDRVDGVGSIINSPLTPLLEFLSNESILEKIYQWSEMSGEWKHVMYLEQLKLYELLISQLCQTDAILFKPSFFQPLIYLLDSLSLFLISNYAMINYVEIEKRLVILLNTLCVSINQNKCLLDLFILCPEDKSSSTFNNKLLKVNDVDSLTSKTAIIPTNGHEKPKKSDSSLTDNCDKTSKITPENDQEEEEEEKNYSDFSFPIFSLLIQFVHREGPIGQQSRDAILLCLAMSRYDERLAYYVANKTDFCPVLATGLSGHFSLLPRVLIGQSIPSEHFQLKHEFISGSKEINHFLKCLDFCNAVVQISHPIIQVQLLKFTFNGFLISVIGPALHQDVANVSVNDLETMPTYSNTLDEIMTTTAYLDLFIRTISEPKLIRIFLEFLCFEVYDNNFIITTLINRIEAKSKLSLITLIFFKTLLDLNCEDLSYELVFKYLLRGKHLKKEEMVKSANNESHEDGKSKKPNSYQSYQKNWLAISAQKLLSSSVSYYLSSLCPHHQSSHYHYQGQQQQNLFNQNDDNESISSFDSNRSTLSCKCHASYFSNYLDYLNDARHSIDQCFLSTKSWRNSYYEPCDLLNEVQDQNIIFCTIELNNHLNNNNSPSHHYGDNNEQPRRHLQEDVILDVNDIITQNSIMAKLSPGFKMKNCYYDEKLKKINYKIESSNALFGMSHHNNNGSNNMNNEQQHPIGPFLSVLFQKFEKFFENDVLTNLHLTGLLTRLCHFPHKLLLSLLFDETLSRRKNVPCFIHLIQKLSLEAQNYCDEMPDFESVFHAAKMNLQSIPIGDLDCPLLTPSNHLRNSTASLIKNSRTSNSDSGSQKAFGLLKNLFFRSSNVPPLTRRPSNASTVSSTGQMLEVVPGGIRFINQHQKTKETINSTSDDETTSTFNELIYNLIIFDEFLMELSAILIEQSVREFCR